MRNIFGQTIELTAFQLTRHPTLRLRQQRKVSSLGTDTILENPLELPHSLPLKWNTKRSALEGSRETALGQMSQSFFNLSGALHTSEEFFNCAFRTYMVNCAYIFKVPVCFYMSFKIASL